MQKTKIQVGVVYAAKERPSDGHPFPVVILDMEADFPTFKYSREVGTHKGMRAQRLDPKNLDVRPPLGADKSMWGAGVGDTFEIASRQVIQTWEEQVAENDSIERQKRETLRRDAAEVNRLRGVVGRIAILLGDQSEKFRRITDREPYKGYRDYQPQVTYSLEADSLLALVEAAHQAGYAAGKAARDA